LFIPSSSKKINNKNKLRKQWYVSRIYW
jgi:hypothetical protein